MDPNQQVFPFDNVFPALIPAIFNSVQDRDDYLSSLDSDTRDYVLKHTDEFSSKSDLMDCVNKLQGQG